MTKKAAILTSVQRFKCGAGIGVIGTWLAEINNDTGQTGDRFHGFRGRAFGVGPIVTYTPKIGESLLVRSGNTDYHHLRKSMVSIGH
jgi:hypothetical protein